jgi:hypothetical protein
MAPSFGDRELRVDIPVVLADDEARKRLAPAVDLASGIVAVVEAVHPHLRDRQRLDRFRKGNAAAGIGVAGEQRLKTGLRQLGLEIAGDFQDRGSGIGPVGDARDLAFEPPCIGWLAVPEDRRLHPRCVESLHLISRDHAAGETADAGKIPGARDIARLRGGGRWRVQQEDEQEDQRPGDRVQRSHRKSL